MNSPNKKAHETLWGLTALSTVVLTGILDHFTGKEISFQAFYLLAILLAGKKASGVWGISTALVSTGAYFLSNLGFYPEVTLLNIHLWNTVMRLTVFVTVAIFLKLWENLPARLKKQVEERTSQLADETAKYRESEQHVEHLNEVLRSIRNVNQLITREKDPQRLFQQACEILVETRGYRLVWIGIPETENKQVVAKAYAGNGIDYLEKTIITWDESVTGQGLNGISIRTGKTQISQDISTDPRFAPFRETALASGFASAVTIPLVYADKVFGVLNIYSDNIDAFIEEEVGLLEELASDISFALAAIEVDRERRRTEESLRLFRSLVDRSNDAIEVIDSKTGRFLDVNEKGCTDLGYSREEILSLNVSDIDPNIDSSLYKSIVEELRKAGSWRMERLHLRKDRTTFPVEIDLKYVQFDRDYIVSVVRDITERKRTEDERKTLLEQLVRAEKLAAVGELIAGVAHEINNPLTGIMGLAELLTKEKKANLDEDIRKDFKSIYQASERIHKIVNNLLRFSHQEAPMRKNIPVSEHIDTVLKIRDYEMKVRNIKVETNYQPDIPQIMADPSQLEQVFLNLIVNAEYAMLETGKGGTLTINVFLQGEQPEQQKVVIEISDTGSGIPADVLPKMFNPFFTTKPVGKGTGLGLSVSYGIIKEHGGEISVSNRKEGGAVFTIKLPVQRG